MPYHEALLYATGIVLICAVYTIAVNQLYFRAFHGALKTRVAVCSLFYRKALRLSQTALGETSPGKMVNLLTNDVSRFDYAIFLVHSLWVAPSCTIVVGILLFHEIGLSGLIGILVILAIVAMLSE